MTEMIALGILALFSGYYVYFITRVRLGLLALHPAKPAAARPHVSVVIAVRNEERSIGACLESLFRQSYPREMYEVIIVDDGSTDTTAAVVSDFARRHTQLHLISRSNDTPDRRGKSAALAEGIGRSTGDVILTTDADCTVPVRWIELMTDHLQNGTVFVAGPVAEQPTGSVLTNVEQLEFLGLITTAAGLIGAGRPINCNGANLGYRKSAFYAAGGFGEQEHSNDDESLMNRIVHRNIGTVGFAPEWESTVLTHSANTPSSFLRQRLRWAGKRNHYEDPSILVSLVLLYLFFVSVAFTGALAVWDVRVLLPVGIVILGKALIDYSTLRAGARLFRQKVPAAWFVLAELLHVPYIVFTAAAGQCGGLFWKGRTINR